jgi:hypothetical protein
VVQVKATDLIQAARAVLEEHHPMTLRQVYYQLVVGQVLANEHAQYKRLSRALVKAREEGAIPAEWMEDRTRRPRQVNMWSGVGEFIADAREWYRLDVWPTQPCYLEVWLEKDALSGIFEPILEPYGVTLCVGRGYDGWDSVNNAVGRYAENECPVTVLYFGDHDPTGLDIERSLRERLGDSAEVVRCALTPEQIEHHSLPPNPTKDTDTRSRAYVAEHGDKSWELDALPPNVLEELIREEIESRMDLEALAEVRGQEAEDKQQLWDGAK